jgi:hypothetical protein
MLSSDSDPREAHVETVTLRAIQQPSEVEMLLHDLVVRGLGTLPDDAVRVHDLNQAPSAVRRLIDTARHLGQSASCWTDGRKCFYLYIAEMSLPMSRERREPVLRVEHLQEDGQLAASGWWFIDRRGSWRRCAE